MQHEKRSHARQNPETSIIFTIDNTVDGIQQAEIRLEGKSKDISATGLRIHGKHAVEKGQQIKLWVEIAQASHKFQLVATVKWVTQTTEDEFVAGLEIDEDKSEDHLEWLAQFSNRN
ncbi:MAG: PilZ domain-containing protein [Enterobacterales bacterium]|nr:PilZ domain-containing protein [Enterobacterales bacterium]